MKSEALVYRQGKAPFAPHLLYPQMLDDEDAAERGRGIDAGLAWLLAADEMLVVGDVRSIGMLAEIRVAHEHGIPMVRVSWDEVLADGT